MILTTIGFLPQKMNMNKLLSVTTSGDYYNKFNPLAYKLEVLGSNVSPLDIFLDEAQTKENYLFSILKSSGVSFKHKINVDNYDDVKNAEGFKEFYLSKNDVMLTSNHPHSDILIEMEPGGNILLCNSLDQRDMIHVFTINTENYMDPPEIIVDDLCNIFNDIGASFNKI